MGRRREGLARKRKVSRLTFHELTISTTERRQCIDITDRIDAVVAESGVATGLCHVYVPHVTAALVVNEAKDPLVMADVLAHLARLVPADGEYRHRCKDDNADAHVQAALLGNQRSFFIRDGRLRLGTYPRIFLCELDGPCQRQVWIGISRG